MKTKEKKDRETLKGLFSAFCGALKAVSAQGLFTFYDIIFTFGLIIYLPVYLYRGKITLAAFREKLGFIRKQGEDSIWIQAVSVGEANLIETLIKKLQESFRYPVVISTTTLTGNIVAKKKYSSAAQVFFFPFDISWIIRKVIKSIKPKIFIAVETEIWPSLFYLLKEKGIPIVIVNGRVSDRAFKRYRLVKPLIRQVVNKCNYIGVQNLSYKERFLSLGCKEEKVVISGNMKFEGILSDASRLLKIKEKYAPALKKGKSLLVVAGSTHHPEEEVIIDVYKELIEFVSAVTLVIAPRHIERIPSIEKIVSSFGFRPSRMSALGREAKGERQVFLLDSVGELLYFYALADICFVGGSLFRYGGHNILEPIHFLKPTCFGPYMDNFKDVEDVVLEDGAGIKVNNSQELKEIFLRLAKDEALRNNLRLKCLRVFERERKSLAANLEIILRCLA